MNASADTSFSSSQREFVGEEGLARVIESGTRLYPKDPRTFRMRVSTVALTRTRILDVRVTPHRGVWDADTAGRFGSAVTLFQFQLAGRAIGNIDGRTIARQPGSLHIIRTGSAMHYVTDAPLHSTMLWVENSLMSTPAIDAIRRVSAEDFRDDVNARGAQAIVASILLHPPTPGSNEAAELERVMIAQLESVAIEADRARDPAIADLFSRIRALIASEVRAEVTSQRLARRLGVSESAVIRTLRAHGTTAAQLLREIRFDRLAELLRDADQPESLAEIAEQAGFNGADQAGRAFRDRTGITMSSYRRMIRL
ncbi:AraC family transcriptional regulator [Microbacteriaceae bacterium VKM Ac-2854]|nr:AraC family transcriptional regulator [Microbacteriaceae bacterium VKM Ac-2854]